LRRKNKAVAERSDEHDLDPFRGAASMKDLFHTHGAIDDEAAHWAVRADRGLSAEEDALLDAWLAEDIRHAGAFAKARAVSLLTERARAFGAGANKILTQTEDEAASAEPTSAISRRYALWMSAAAATAGFWFALGALPRYLRERSYETGIGETRVVPLEDGSLVTLNTQSKVTVAYSAQRRDISLVAGEALFDVAKDKERPFVVLAGGMQVRAVGTSFTVRLVPNEPVQVLVREGVVEVKRPDVPTAPPVRVAAGSQALAPDNTPIVAASLTKSEVDKALAWRIGRIVFEGETLRKAAADFARYSDTRIVIDDPAVSNMTITGLFVSNDPVGFARAVAQSLNLRARVSAGEVHLSR
jgi:transmembrane sensor